MYRIIVQRSAEKDLKRLSSEICARAATEIMALAKSPRPAGSRKLAGTESDWRIRVGDYRIIYEIAEEIRIVRINRASPGRSLPMKITEDVRKYAAEQAISEEETLQKGMEEKSKEIVEKGAEVYAKA